jgi:hypothetical protein
MFILHVKHYFCQEILKVHSLQKRCRVSILLRLLPANYKIFEVPVLVFARAFGNAVSAVRPWDRGWLQIGHLPTGRRERGRGNGNTSSVPIRDAGFAGGKTF